MPIKLAIGCYNHLLGEALKKLTADAKEIQTIGVFNEGMEFNEILKMCPDVVLVDLSIFHTLLEGFAMDIKTKILLIGDQPLNSMAERRIADLVGRGVVGILPRGADSRLLRRAIKVVCSGELWLDRKTMSNILSYENISRKERLILTKTEKEIADLICLGYKNKEIAQKMNITEQTVKSHCNRIYKKVEVPDRLQLAIKLWRDRCHPPNLN